MVGHEQLDRIKTAIKAVVSGLADHDDTDPPPAKGDKGAVGPTDAEQDVPHNPHPADVDPPGSLPAAWRGPSAVLCIAGRGPLDEAAASMLAQLLGKHGLNGRLVGYGDVSREAVEHLDVTGVAMACVSYLDISGSPSHLRYLMRRLRQKLPKEAPILVGLWPSEDSTLKDKAVQREIGADYFTSSLGEAVTACVQASEQAADQRP